MVGSVPPPSMRSMSSSVRAACTARSATDRPRAVRMSYRALPKGQGLADRDPLGVVSGFGGTLPAGVVAGHLPAR
jgi:hypothetical protein